MCTHLTKRGSTYYFRRVIPIELRSAFDGKREIIYSLKTKDRDTGKELCRLEAVKVDELFRDARTKLETSFLPSEEGGDGVERITSDDREATERSERREARRHFHVLLSERLRLSTSKLSPYEAAIKDLLLGDNFDPEHAKGQLAEYADRLGNAKAKGRLEALWQPAQSLSKTAPLLDLFNAYVAERKPQSSTVQRWKPIMEHLIAYVGHSDAGRMTADNLLGWKDYLLTEKKANGELRDPKTVKDTYLMAANVVFGWAAENRKISANPVKGITVRLPKKMRLRDPGFTNVEAVTILRAALSPDAGKLATEHALARRWVPWLCAYTGARVNELTQLRAEDVQQLEGVWAIRITPEAGAVKNGAARTVPLHPHLIEQGFVAVAKAKGTGPLFYAPDRRRKAREGGRHYKKVGERLASWVRSIGVSDPAVLPNHGWRHMFKTRARLVGMESEVRDAIQGHALKTEGQKYGSFPITMLAQEIAKLPRWNIAGASDQLGILSMD